MSKWVESNEYVEGRKAYNKRAPITANPYSMTLQPKQYRAWRNGWRGASFAKTARFTNASAL